jgi:cytochrome oxidase Cu insertion factor (SCO1/SenC/PrrC family)
MKGLRASLVAEPALAARVRFVSISFDPTHDTPEALRLYAGGLQDRSPFEWRFLTARSMADLTPLLDQFGQDVQVETDAEGKPTRAINHMLKVFLIDAAGVVREIYALDYLHPAVILNDIRTLVLEANE